MLPEIRIARFLIVLIFLLYACKLDIESRIVPNRIWKWMLIAALPITAAELYLMRNLIFPHLAFFMVLQFLVIFALSYLFYLLGTFGGADAKALMCLAIIFPIYPSINGFPLLNTGFGIFAFATLTNSVIAAPIIALAYFVRNVVKEGVREMKHSPFYYFIGTRVKPSEIPKHYYLLEYIDENGEIVRVKRAVEPDEDMLRRIKKLDRVWITPALPFLVFITIGYVAALLFGNTIYAVLSLFVGDSI